MYVVIVSCASAKLDKKAPVKDIYISDLFKKSMAYSKSLNPDKVFILSAKYHLLKLDDVIEPYDVTLGNISKEKRNKNEKMASVEKKYFNYSMNVT